MHKRVVRNQVTATTDRKIMCASLTRRVHLAHRSLGHLPLEQHGAHNITETSETAPQGHACDKLI
jgi:hypothetical protein